MVAGKVKSAMGLHKSPKPDKPLPPLTKPPSPSPSPSSTAQKSTVFNRSFGVYFPRSSAQVQPKPPDVSELLKLVDELHNRESRLRTQLVEQKLLRESAAIVPSLEAEITARKTETEQLLLKFRELEVENVKLVSEREVMKEIFECERREKDMKIAELMSEVEEAKQLSSSQRFQGLIEASGKSNLIKNLSSFRKMGNATSAIVVKLTENNNNFSHEPEIEPQRHHRQHCSSVDEIPETSDSSSFVRSRVPRVPKPPPKRSFSDSHSHSLSSSSSSLSDGRSHPPPPPPPPLPSTTVKSAPAKKAPVPPPPPPPALAKGLKMMSAKVKRVPEVVEFYHSLMRRDSRRDSGAGTAEAITANARDLVGEIENRSAYLLAVSFFFI